MFCGVMSVGATLCGTLLLLTVSALPAYEHDNISARETSAESKSDYLTDGVLDVLKVYLQNPAILQYLLDQVPTPVLQEVLEMRDNMVAKDEVMSKLTGEVGSKRGGASLSVMMPLDVTQKHLNGLHQRRLNIAKAMDSFGHMNRMGRRR